MRNRAASGWERKRQLKRQAEAQRAADREHQLQVKRDERRATRWRRWTIETIGTVVGIATIGGLYLGFVEFQQQREEQNAARMVRAWEVLRNAVNAKGNVGQITALETLYRGGENINYISLGCPEDIRSDFKIGSCVFLQGVDLRFAPRWETRSWKVVPFGATLFGANLRGANLSYAELHRTRLTDADLRRADLRRADLSYADLRRADLSYADLRRANLKDANLLGADLFGANLTGADLGGAQLREADLGLANLKDASLLGAELGGADLGGVDLLTQQQINIVGPSSPPKNLPSGIVWPFENRDGKWVRKKKE